MFRQIKPRKDNVLHHSPHTKYWFPHIDMATLPEEFAVYGDVDHELKNMWRVKEGVEEKKCYVEEEVEDTSIFYKAGDKRGIDMGQYLYALGELVLRMYQSQFSQKDKSQEIQNGQNID
jgi:hypothetical protein